MTRRAFAIAAAGACLVIGVGIGANTHPPTCARYTEPHEAGRVCITVDPSTGEPRADYEPEPEEDEAGWDCRTMGNQTCSPTTTQEERP